MSITNVANQPCARCGSLGNHHSEPIHCFCETTWKRGENQNSNSFRIRESEARWDISLCLECETTSFKEDLNSQVKTLLSRTAVSLLIMAVAAGAFAIFPEHSVAVGKEVGPGLSREGPFMVAALVVVLVGVGSAFAFIYYLLQFVTAIKNKASYAASRVVPIKQRARAYRRFAEVILHSLKATTRHFHGSFDLPVADSQRSTPKPGFSRMEKNWILETEADYNLANASLETLEAYFAGMPLVCLTRLAELPKPPATLLNHMRSHVLVGELSEEASKLPPEDSRSQFPARLLNAAISSRTSFNRTAAIIIWILLVLLSLLDLSVHSPNLNSGIRLGIVLLALLECGMLFGPVGEHNSHTTKIIKNICDSWKKHFPTQSIPIHTTASKWWLAVAWLGIVLNIVAVAELSAHGF